MDNLISIITTVKNGEQYIRETLESVLNQTYTNYEHIIVDDGSKDNSIDVIESFIKVHSDYPLRLYVPGNLGRGGALNYAVSKAKGTWVAILDADDLWHKKKLMCQIHILKEEIDICATSSELFTDSVDLNKSLYNIRTRKINSNKLLLSNNICHSSVIIKKKLAQYNESRKGQFDYELWLRLLLEKKNIVVVDEKLTMHRIHKNQSFEAKNIYKYKFKSIKLQFKYILLTGKYVLLMPLFLKIIYYLLPSFRRLKV